MESEKIKILETIVVEGRDDLINLRRFVDAHIIVTSGYHISEKTMLEVERASAANGVIIFTDPDRAGDMIRERVEKRCSGVVKHAYITRDEAFKNGDIGVENADREAVLSALTAAKCLCSDKRAEFTKADLYALGLSGFDNSALIRRRVCDRLRIKRSNSKSLLRALNSYGIKREEVLKILEEVIDK